MRLLAGVSLASLDAEGIGARITSKANLGNLAAAIE
jgi:hypothetical protein